MAAFPEYDVAVVGGGIAGTMAAIAAAREGCRTLLLERYTALGGMGTLGMVQPITTWGIRGHYVVGGTGKLVLEALAAGDPTAATAVTTYGPSCDVEHLKYALECRALAAGVELLYHCWVCGATTTAAGTISALRVLSKGGEFTVTARTVIDASGDADVAAWVGVPCDVDSQGVSLMVLVSGIDRERCPDRGEIGRIYDRHRVGYRGLALFWHPRPDSAYLNVTEVEDTDALDARGLTAATINCRRQAWEVLAVMREHVPGFADAHIAAIAPALGVRETRRIHGLYRLSLADVTAGRDFVDTIARAACPVDVHGSADEGRGVYYGLKRSYGIPNRALIASGRPNLIVTGRPISADHAAHSSLRRMAPGFALGEAAGIAAALAADGGDVGAIDVALLRRKLRAYGAILDPEPEPSEPVHTAARTA